MSDRFSHDISNSVDEMEDFINTVDACFINGGVFRPVPAASGTGRSSQASRETVFITERVRRQIARKCVFHCGSRDQLVWGQITRRDFEVLSLS